MERSRRRIYIYAMEAPGCTGARIALSVRRRIIRKGETLYAEYSSPVVKRLFDYLKQAALKSHFGEATSLVPTPEMKDDFVTTDSAQSLDTELFSYLTGFGDGELSCTVAFTRKKPLESNPSRQTVVSVRLETARGAL